MLGSPTTLKFYHDGIEVGVKSAGPMEKFDAEAWQPLPQTKNFWAKRGKFRDKKFSTIFAP